MASSAMPAPTRALAPSPSPSPSETRIHAIYGTTIVEIVLSITFVALRLRARRLCFGYLRLDLSDWLAISALLATLAYLIILIVWTVVGLGRHALPDADIRGFTIVLLLSNTLHPAAIGLLKLSILALYRSIFPSPRFRLAVTTTALFVVAWTVSTLILGLAYCVPVESQWDPSVPPVRCLPLYLIGLVTTSIHIGVEIFIFLMPIPSVLKLQVPTEKKRLIILTFVVGGVGCIVSIARIPFWVLAQNVLAKNSDASWEGVPAVLLGATELTVGLLAVSFPTYRPLFKKPAGQSARISEPPSSCQAGFDRSQHEVTVLAAGNRPTRHIGIMVTNEIELMRHPNAGGGWMKVPDETQI